MKFFFISILVLNLVLQNSISAQTLNRTKPIEVSNNKLSVVCNQNNLSLWISGTENPFMEEIRVNADSQKMPETIREKHPVWGTGSVLSIPLADGNVLKVSVYDKLPFVMMQRILVNHTNTESRIARDTLFTGNINLGQAAEKLRVNSIAGLKPASKSSSGYVFLAVGNPENYEGVVYGWLTSERGSGIVFSENHEGKVQLSARIDYGDLRIPAGKSAETEILLIGYGKDVRDLLEQYGDAIALQYKVKLPPQPSVYCTWYHARASDEKSIAENTLFAEKFLKPRGFHVIQIDDYWQLGVKENGPRRNFTGARPDGPYPSGMKKTADFIHSKGFVPGIWYIPFAGSWNDPFWKDKMDLFLKEGNSPANFIYQMDGVTENTFPKGEAPYEARWGGTCIDLTNPKAQEYVKFIANRFANEWGYKYFKADGLWTGTGTPSYYINAEYKDDDLGMQTRFNPAVTPVESYAKGLELIKEGAGSDLFLLGCCMPQNMRSFGPAMGRVDAMRVGPDNGASPRLLIRGPQFSTRVFFLNKRVWYNDPDPVYVRPSFPEEMAKTSVSWVSLTGSMHSSSEQYNLLPRERLDILLKSLPSHGLKTVQPVDFLENDPATVWHLFDEKEGQRKDVIGLFNWDVTKNVSVSVQLDRIKLPRAEQYVGFDFWENRFIPPFSGAIEGLLAPGGCQIISIRPVQNFPQVISTSLHLTQGIIELSNEKWDDKKLVLSGTSNIIGDEEYEIRIVVPKSEKSWMAKSVKVDAATLGLKTSFQQDGTCLRVKIHSPESKEINWAVDFESANIVNNKYPLVSLNSEANYGQVELQIKNGPPFQTGIFRNNLYIGKISTDKYTDNNVELGETYTYRIEPVLWNGEILKVPEIAVKMPQKVELPAVPDLPEIMCSQLKPVRTSGSIKPQLVSENNEKPEGVSVKSRLGTNGASTIVYNIPEGAKRFVSSVILKKTGGPTTEAKTGFIVLGDVLEMGEPAVELAKSPVLKVTQNNVWHFDIALDNRLKQIILQVEILGGDGENYDADWINAGFISE